VPVVSIVTPAYNAASYIESAITSALRQTFADLEILVVDDGSTDDTAAIVARVASGDPRVQLLRQPNRGVSAARNAAMRSARGRYFAFLDSDDLWHAGFLEAQIGLLESRPDIDVVTGNAFVLGGPRDGQPARPFPDPRPHPTTADMIADETAVFIMCAFRRAVYDTIGGFDETKATNEDYDFWIRAAHAGFRFWRNDTPLGQYRTHANSLSANESRMLRGILVVLTEHRARIAGRPEESAALERQIERFETELKASEARLALEAGDYKSAARHLDALAARRPTASLTLARGLARWTPGLLAWLYRTRRARLERAAYRRVPS
jgi:glycosyltransferase involved in cell wall biosynthesis